VGQLWNLLVSLCDFLILLGNLDPLPGSLCVLGPCCQIQFFVVEILILVFSIFEYSD